MTEAPQRVLVTDGNQRPALAVVRSLGARGHQVTVAAAAARSLAGASTYCQRSLVYPPPGQDPAGFAQWLAEQTARGDYDVVLPVTEVTTDLVCREPGRWRPARVPFADIEAIDALSNKVALVDRCRALDVPVPRSVTVRTPEAVDAAIAEIGLPCVLKPARSRVAIDGGFLATTVALVDDAEDLARALERPDFAHYPFLVQERVSGEARGVFAVYNRGRPTAFFAHRRLREKPPTGGVSVLSEGSRPDPALGARAHRLLASVAWHGPAMVEFKGDYIMEVNARFWGSLQLAVDCGVDFPAMVVADDPPTASPEALLERPVRPMRLRWWLGDFDRLYLCLKQRRGPLWREVRDFLTPDFGRTRHETFRWKDPGPAWAELKAYVAAVLE